MALIESVPEQSEMALLGAMILDTEALKYGLAHVRETDFTDSKRRAIFSVMQKLNEGGSAVDLPTVVDAWQKTGDSEFDPVYPTTLADAPTTVHHAPGYAKRVRSAGILRDLRVQCEETIRQSNDGRSAAEILQEHAAAICRLTEECTGATQERFSLPKAFSRAIDALEKQAQPERRFPFGIAVLDDAFAGGLLPGEMVVVGGFPGHGKTSLALWILGQNLALGHRCLFVSYEMREAALIHRLFSQQLGIPSSRLRGGNGELSQGEWRQITEFCNTSQELPLVIADNVSLRLSGIESLVESYQPQLVFVDYLQLIRGEGKKSQHRYEVVEDLMHGFAALAHRTGVAIVLLSQLRKPEGDSEPLPRLHLLKDSSSIEQAAHAVILVQLTSDASELRQFSLTVVKNRSGRLLFWTPIYFDAPVFRFGTAETRESVLRMPEAAMGDAEI